MPELLVNTTAFERNYQSGLMLCKNTLPRSGLLARDVSSNLNFQIAFYREWLCSAGQKQCSYFISLPFSLRLTAFPCAGSISEWPVSK